MKTCIFTSIALNYLPKASVLAESVKARHPDIHFCLLVGEPVPDWLRDSTHPFDEVVSSDSLVPDRSWIFKHSIVEYCTAIKGQMLVNILERGIFDNVFYFDPDTVLLDRIDRLIERFEIYSVLLTPHILDPEESDQAIRDNEIIALQHGVYNLGFLGVKNDTAGRRFAEWWRHRLTNYCRDDIPKGLFTDQRWVDLAVAYFPEIEIVRDAGCNVATWNLTHRTVEGSFDRGFTVNGNPLTFYHFSGFDSGNQLAMLQRYGNEAPALYELRRWYIDACAKHEASVPALGPWRYGFFDSGKTISTSQRRVYRERPDLQETFPDPFDDSGDKKGYRGWFERRSGDELLYENTISADHLRRELEMIYRSRGWKLLTFLRTAKRRLSLWRA
ncbi:glycosyl transferase [Chelativorans multitrophicus]|uniref:glycosyl transferase n=1 Tax=Chelativorans multitrophicus TaxID=449973 RepID=UPI001408FD66|nr:glycosyl transferase [Chelativorans multitrophicus]